MPKDMTQRFKAETGIVWKSPFISSQ